MIGAVAWLARGWLASVRDIVANLTITVKLDRGDLDEIKAALKPGED